MNSYAKVRNLGLHLFLFYIALGSWLPAATLTTTSFVPFPQGSNPVASLLLASDGNYYGTTTKGGTFDDGTLFRITPAGSLTTLINFNGTNGSTPASRLIQASDGNLYGTTANGGALNSGTFYRLTLAGEFNTLFNFNILTGSNCPYGVIQASDGNFYGAASGTSFPLSFGSIFKITPQGNLTHIHDFTGSDGYEPTGTLVQAADGNLYGAAGGGGTGNGGMIFKLGLDSSFSTLISFNTTNGANPNGSLIQGTDGNLYGTTLSGGSGDGSGTVFKASTTGTLTTLYNFNSAAGSRPCGNLVRDGQGNLFGATGTGGPSGNGTLFKLTPANVLTTLVDFNSANGANPGAGLIVGSDGSYYGTASNGGAGKAGTIFKMTPGGALTTISSFVAVVSTSPTSLIQGSDGNFYGTTSIGVNGDSIFKMTPDGTLSNLVSLDANNLFFVNPQLIQASDGNLYGSTNDGDGSKGNGKIIKITTTGSVGTLFSFNNTNGATPFADLVQAADGNIYGMTKSGGPAGVGTAYKISLSGSLTTLTTFNNSTFPGTSPYQMAGALVQNSDGNFYGATHSGPNTLFKMTPAGVVTNLFTFTGANGSNPGGLMQGSDGNFYFAGQGNQSGSTSVALYKLTPAGAVTNLVTASESGGYGAFFAALVQTADGNFYGTTSAGGNSNTNYGTIFTANPAGTLNNLFILNSDDAQNPSSAMVKATNGKLYGVAGGGTASAGAVYCVNPASIEQVTLNSSSSIPIVTSAYTINGSSLGLNLGFAPAPGTVLTIVKNTGIFPNRGTFTNLPDGGQISALFNGVTYTFAANYEDGDGNDLTLTLAAGTAPIITSANSATFVVGQQGNFPVTATGSPAPTFSATGLPPWATLNPTTGLLTGTPTTAIGAPISITISASNGVSPVAQQNFSLNVTTSFASWASQQGLSGASAAQSAVVVHDGLTNLFKYALGLNAATNYNPGDSNLPIVQIPNGGNHLTLTFTGVATDVTYTVQATNDLTGVWTTVYTSQGSPVPGTKTVQDSQLVSDSAKRFMRLQITKP